MNPLFKVELGSTTETLTSFTDSTVSLGKG